MHKGHIIKSKYLMSIIAGMVITMSIAYAAPPREEPETAAGGINAKIAVEETDADREKGKQETSASSNSVEGLIEMYAAEGDKNLDYEAEREDERNTENGEDKSRRVAHTGRAGKAAQSSVLAFTLAGQAGYWGIETDLRWTKDHVLVCFHDEDLETHTDGKGSVEGSRWDYLSTLHVFAGNIKTYGAQPIATFDEYLNICKEYGCTAVIDIKYCSTGYKDMLRAAYDMVCEKEMLSQVVFQCSLDSYLEEMHNIDPECRLWKLCGQQGATSESTISNAAQVLHCEAACVPVNSVEASSLSHKYGLACIYYQTDSQSEQQKCFDNGFDMVVENGSH